MATTLTASNQEFKPQVWEEVPCPFCQSKDFSILERFGFQHQYTYVRCSRCQLTYQNPRPKFDETFQETAYEHYSTSVDDTWNGTELTEWGKKVHKDYTFVVSEIESLLGRKGRILDIGCATGFFGKAAKDYGWTPVGIDISRTMVRLAQEKYGIEAYAGDWTQMDFKEPFDAIHCSHVIEHIPDPSDWMRNYAKWLKPDGILCLAVPNMQSLDRRFKRVLKNLKIRKDRWQPWRTPDHLYEPCERSMVPFVEKHGFRVIKKYTYPSVWDGKLTWSQALYHQNLRWGAKLRLYLTKI